MGPARMLTPEEIAAFKAPRARILVGFEHTNYAHRQPAEAGSRCPR